MKKLVVLALLAVSGVVHAESSTDTLTLTLPIYDQNNTFIQGELTADFYWYELRGQKVLQISSADLLNPMVVKANVGGVVKGFYLLQNAKNYHESAKLICKAVNDKYVYGIVNTVSPGFPSYAVRGIDNSQALVANKNGYLDVVQVGKSNRGAAAVSIRCSDTQGDLNAGTDGL